MGGRVKRKHNTRSTWQQQILNQVLQPSKYLKIVVLIPFYNPIIQKRCKEWPTETYPICHQGFHIGREINENHHKED